MFHYSRLTTLMTIFALIPFVQGCTEERQTRKAPSEQSEPQTQDTTSPANQPLDMKRLSEAFGNFIGRNLKNPGPKFDLEAMIAGMRKGYEGKPGGMPEEEYKEQMQQYEELAFQAVAEQNLQEANNYLQNMKSQSNVVEIEPDKLYYSVEAEGESDSKELSEEATPSVRYKGMFPNGTVFGSSEDTGGTVLLSLQQTIPGFRQGVLGMKKGEKRKLYVHPDLGYGTSGQLPPNQLLIFEIEMVDPDAKPQFIYNPKTKQIEPTSALSDQPLPDQGLPDDQQLQGQAMSDQDLPDEDLPDTDLNGEEEEYMMIDDEDDEQ